MMTMVFQGLRHPAPFSDDLEPADKPYKRVSMDEAKRGTSCEWDFPKSSLSTNHPPPPQPIVGFFEIILTFPWCHFKRRYQNRSATIIMKLFHLQHIKETKREKIARRPPTAAAFLSFVSSSAESMRRRLMLSVVYEKHCRVSPRELARHWIYSAFRGLKLRNRQKQN